MKYRIKMLPEYIERNKDGKTQGRSFRICPLVSGLQTFYQEMTPSAILFLSDPVLMVYFYYESYKTYKCTINT